MAEWYLHERMQNPLYRKFYYRERDRLSELRQTDGA